MPWRSSSSTRTPIVGAGAAAGTMLSERPAKYVAHAVLPDLDGPAEGGVWVNSPPATAVAVAN